MMDMNEEILNKRTKAMKSNLNKAMTQWFFITVFVVTIEVCLLIRLFQYTTIQRIDMVLFVLAIGGFCGCVYGMIWYSISEIVTEEVTRYKRFVDEVIYKTRQTAEYGKAYFSASKEVKPKVIASYSGKAKNFRGFKENKKAGEKND